MAGLMQKMKSEGVAEARGHWERMKGAISDSKRDP